MPSYNFYNDYSEGAHPNLLELMTKTNFHQEDGYGNDSLCLQAAELIKSQIENPAAAIHFIPGGTQANLIALSSMLRPHESVICADTGHIHVHEAGAVEATGHKLNTIATPNGKLTGAQIQAVVAQHTDEHMVKPRVVFISNTTEVGTVYRKSELEKISRVCRENNLILYLDGARLGSALTCRSCDCSLAELGRLVDMFYIGGTKNGALLGEALVINSPALQADFRYFLKQKGALLAKGRIMGVQFLGLFQDGLYFELARHANVMAEKLAAGIKAQGFDFLTEPSSNQIFPVFPDTLIEKLRQQFGFYVWTRIDAGRSAVRLVTSWATPEAKIDEFLRALEQLAQA